MSTIELVEGGTPPTPSAGRRVLFAAAAGLSEVDDAGAVQSLVEEFGKDYQFAATEGDVTSTSDTPVTAVTLVATARTGKYIVAWHYEAKVTAGSPGTWEVGVQNQTDVVTLAFTEQNGTDNGEDRGVSGFQEVTFTGSAKTFVIEVSNNASGTTANVRKARLAIWKAEA